MKHSKALDHLLVAIASLQEGDVEQAEEALQDTLASDDLDETLAELSEMQDEALANEDVSEGDEEVAEAIEEALEDEEGVEVARVRGRMIVTMAGVRNARQAKRVFKSLASVEDVEDVDPEEFGLEGEEAVQATIDGEEVVVSFDEDGEAEVFQAEAGKHCASRKKVKASRKQTRASAEDLDDENADWDDADEYPEAKETASRRRSKATRALASLNLKRIARNRNSL